LFRHQVKIKPEEICFVWKATNLIAHPRVRVRVLLKVTVAQPVKDLPHVFKCVAFLCWECNASVVGEGVGGGFVEWCWQEKSCPSATCWTADPTCTDLKLNPVLRGESPGTNSLSFPVLYWTQSALSDIVWFSNFVSMWCPCAARCSFVSEHLPCAAQCSFISLNTSHVP
jgi:hypothetical protein